MAERRLGLGFIGLGQAMNLILQRRWELDGLPIDIVAGADPRQGARARFVADFGGSAYASAEELCADPAVDIVYIATGPELHREHASLAARHGKHMIVEKPLALTVEDCLAIVKEAEEYGVLVVAGHTHSFGAPYLKMAELVHSGALGELVMVNSWMYNEFNPRPWPTAELESTRGPLLNQGPHQVDIVRQIAGGEVTSLRATTFHDSLRGVLGGYTALLTFAGGASANIVFDARGFFDVAELFGWIGEGGQPKEPDRPFTMRRNFKEVDALGPELREQRLHEQKELGRYGAKAVTAEEWALWGYSFGQEHHQPFFGLTVASCERGAIRQSADGLYIYGETEVSEISLASAQRGRAAELMELYGGVVEGRPLVHDARWATGTIEVCLAIEASARLQAEVPLVHQTAYGSIQPDRSSMDRRRA